MYRYFDSNYRPNDIVIYHCTSGNDNPITWGKFRKETFRVAQDNPVFDVLWYPSVSPKTHGMLHKIDVVLYHTIPAIVLDSILWLTGRRPKIYSKKNKIKYVFSLKCIKVYF